MSNIELLKAVKAKLHSKAVLKALPPPDQTGKTIKFKSWAEPHFPWPSITQTTEFEHGGGMRELLTIRAGVARILEDDVDGMRVNVSTTQPLDATADAIVAALIVEFDKELKREASSNR